MNFAHIRKMIVNFEDRVYCDRKYLVNNEYGYIAIVYADNEQDAMDALVDHGRLDSCMLSATEWQEYIDNGWEEDICFLGNAGEPFLIANISIQELV